MCVHLKEVLSAGLYIYVYVYLKQMLYAGLFLICQLGTTRTTVSAASPTKRASTSFTTCRYAVQYLYVYVRYRCTSVFVMPVGKYGLIYVTPDGLPTV